MNKDSEFSLAENRKEHYEELINNMPYKDKVQWAKTRIKEFFIECEKKKNINEITVSFSGGKDSTVLLDLVMKVHHEMKVKIPIVMVYATEITFPSTFKFINEVNEKYMKKYPGEIKHVQMVHPKKTWNEILSQHGYPIFSKQISVLINRVKRAKTKNLLTKWFFGIDIEKTSTARYRLSYNRLFLLDNNMLNNWPKIPSNLKSYFAKYDDKYFFSEKCCDFIKGNLKHDHRPSFIGTMAEESMMRKRSWINNGCNILNAKAMKSRPLSIWNKNDIWKYIKLNDLDVNQAYGYDRTKDILDQNLRFDRLGCTSCPYGSAIEQRLIDKLKDKNDTKNYRSLNRFEILHKDYPNIYKTQVIMNGMYKVLIDMGIKIQSDDNYKKLYKLRHKQIDEWYNTKNLKNNILSVMVQIENYKDWKNNGSEWTYTKNEFKQAMDFFKQIEDKTIDMDLINNIRNELLKNK